MICFVKPSRMRCFSQCYLFFILLGDVVSDISFTLTLNAQLLHTADIPGARMIKMKTLHLQELLSRFLDLLKIVCLCFEGPDGT